MRKMHPAGRTPAKDGPTHFWHAKIQRTCPFGSARRSSARLHCRSRNSRNRPAFSHGLPRANQQQRFPVYSRSTAVSQASSRVSPGKPVFAQLKIKPPQNRNHDSFRHRTCFGFHSHFGQGSNPNGNVECHAVFAGRNMPPQVPSKNY